MGRVQLWPDSVGRLRRMHGEASLVNVFVSSLFWCGWGTKRIRWSGSVRFAILGFHDSHLDPLSVPP